MSNTSDGPAEKGSKFWMQRIVNTPAMSLQLENCINLGKIKWFSPLRKDNYKEYKLNSNYIPSDPEKLICNALDIVKKDLDFWPHGGPQWDAIGIINKGGKETILLVEAKSYIGEIKEDCKAEKNLKNHKKIVETLTNVHKEIVKKVSSNHTINDFPASPWLGNLYQIANRLAFFYNIKYLIEEKKDVVLVFLLFGHDYTHGDDRKLTGYCEWSEHMNGVTKALLGCNLSDLNLHFPEIKTVYYDVGPVNINVCVI